jgi:hypothetical protein
VLAWGTDLVVPQFKRLDTIVNTNGRHVFLNELLLAVPVLNERRHTPLERYSTENSTFSHLLIRQDLPAACSPKEITFIR